MKLTEALRLSQHPPETSSDTLTVYLACGFTPLHLSTFVAAHLRLANETRGVTVDTGLFDDLRGNIARLQRCRAHAGIVVIEWADLDPRLGLRRLGGWGRSGETELVQSARLMLKNLLDAIVVAAEHLPIVVSLPTLPLPPAFMHRPERAQIVTLHLRQAVTDVALELAMHKGVKVVSFERLDRLSNHDNRFDVKMELSAGFPYTMAHTSCLSEQIASLLHPPEIKKGLITDLDDTLWAGIVGELGADSVHWDLDNGAQIHGLYQQLVASLAESGTLVAVASKNEPAIVAQAFAREDFLVDAQAFFPLEVHWEPKSRSVSRILDAWNIGADSVVFVDDSERELAEVNNAHPDVTCLRFDRSDTAACYHLIEQLRDLFAKDEINEEDRIRAQSLRRANEASQERGSAGSEEEFLRSLESSIRFEDVTADTGPRPLELINKTNQFNLNGKRLAEGDWTSLLERPQKILQAVSYRDRFGPLGRIAVLSGVLRDNALEIDHWVMSCRAFSRRVEHACLARLFDVYQAERIVFDFQQTERNGPSVAFFRSLLGEAPVPGCELTHSRFQQVCPPLYYSIETDADE